MRRRSRRRRRAFRRPDASRAGERAGVDAHEHHRRARTEGVGHRACERARVCGYDDWNAATPALDAGLAAKDPNRATASRAKRARGVYELELIH